MQTSSSSVEPDMDFIYDGYEEFMDSVHNHFKNAVASGNPLFTTSGSEDLFEKYFVSNLSDAKKQHYNCNCCKKFVNTYGGLVYVDSSGNQQPVLWPDPALVPNVFKDSVKAMRKFVLNSKISGVFLSEEVSWGQKKTGIWNHLSVTPPKAIVFKETVLNASQVMAEKLQDRQTLIRGLLEFKADTVREAHKLLTNGQLYRSEKCIGVAAWLLELHESTAASKRNKDNLIWRAVATAPPGFCHVKSTMIGTLLEDISSGLAFETIKQRFDSKMNPLKYQRPDAAPSAGTIAQAEKIMEKLQSAGSLDRRFAKLEDVISHAIWTPTEKVKQNSNGVFGHLKTKEEVAPKTVTTPPIVVTWDKFSRTVLPTAESIEFLVKDIADSYFAFLTATDPDSPPILQWDNEEVRNPVSWYVYSGGSYPSKFGLRSGYVSVNAITPKPSSWNNSGITHQGLGAYFILEGAKDSESSSLALFPECLKSDYHGIRSVIEAHSRSRQASGLKAASACGVVISDNTKTPHTFRVTTKSGTVSIYTIDRWD